MHREVDPPVEQRLVDLLGEQTLAADLGEAAVLHRIARRADHVLLERAEAAECGEAGAGLRE